MNWRPSPEMLNAICAALPDHKPGIRPHEIARKVETWAPATVRTALTGLVSSGRVAFTGEHPQRRYWRAAIQEHAA